MDLLKLAGLGHCYNEMDRYGWDYLALVTQPAVASRTGSAVEAVEPVGSVGSIFDAVESVGAAVEAVEPVVAAVEAVQFVGAALEATESVDAETGDVRDEVVCVGHG